MTTALTWGYPPKRTRGVPAMNRARVRKAEVTEAQLESYAGSMLEFQEWCERHGINFRAGVMDALTHYRQLMEDDNGA